MGTNSHSTDTPAMCEARELWQTYNATQGSSEDAFVSVVAPVLEDLVAQVSDRNTTLEETVQKAAPQVTRPESDEAPTPVGAAPAYPEADIPAYPVVPPIAQRCVVVPRRDALEWLISWTMTYDVALSVEARDALLEVLCAAAPAQVPAQNAELVKRLDYVLSQGDWLAADYVLILKDCRGAISRPAQVPAAQSPVDESVCHHNYLRRHCNICNAPTERNTRT